jgi:YidC/Oxa1 family membrane protein insertase
MQQLQPELKLIQSKYKEDKQRQQQEMMKFYKDNKVNPLGSCLPLVAQLPVFVSLYYMLRQSLRADICPQVQPHHIVNGVSVINTAATKACGVGHGASFLFIGDLTNKASGVTLIILILLYVGTQLGSTLMMSGATVDPTQRKIMLFMPLVFVLFVIRFPAGVLVYWITTNAWTIGQQYVVRRRIGPVTAVTSLSLATNGSGKAPAASRSGPSNGASKSASAAKSASDAPAAGGLTSLIRRAAGQTEKPANKPAEKSDAKGKKPTPVGTGARGGPPPRSPRKKKKRSGRRR